MHFTSLKSLLLQITEPEMIKGAYDFRNRFGILRAQGLQEMNEIFEIADCHITRSINTDSLIETFKEIHRTIALSYRIDDNSRHKSCVLRRKQFALNSLEFPLYQTTLHRTVSREPISGGISFRKRYKLFSPSK